MKFYISRCSDGVFNEETPPIDGVKGETLPYVQEFYDGTSAQRTRIVWPIEVPNLEVLMLLLKNEGNLVIKQKDDVYPFGPIIIIYDDYLE